LGRRGSVRGGLTHLVFLRWVRGLTAPRVRGPAGGGWRSVDALELAELGEDRFGISAAGLVAGSEVGLVQGVRVVAVGQGIIGPDRRGRAVALGVVLLGGG